jgi:hypothetical protein
MLVGAVVRDKVEDQLEPAIMRSGNQPVEVFEGSEDRVNGAVVGYVVAEIRHRRWIDR